jgi:hypothetical protein
MINKKEYLFRILNQIKKPKFFYILGLAGYNFTENYLLNKNKLYDPNMHFVYKHSLNYEDYTKLFEHKILIFDNKMKKFLNITTPFNRQIKQIYDLPYVYPEYENYNFNKLSDFFLNIHIFIN